MADELFLKLKDVELLALVIYGEARGEGYHGMYAVGQVALNRVRRKGWYGNTLKEVILKPFQFSCFNPSDRGYLSLLEFAADFEKAVENNFTLELCYNVARNLLITKDATHYFANYIPKPSWAEKMKKLGEIRVHEFYEEQ